MAASAQHHVGVGERSRTRPEYQAFQLLHVAFTAVPVLAGLDKFFHLLTDWDMYLAPWIVRINPISTHDLMFIVGIIEIVAGALVAFRPRIGAWVVGGWLCLIIVNLFTFPGYLDIALRDFGLASGAFALARLSLEFDKPHAHV